MKKIILVLIFLLTGVGNAVMANYATNSGIAPAGMHRIRPDFSPVIPPVVHAQKTTNYTTPLLPLPQSADGRVFVGARMNPYYQADCKNPQGFYDSYYCGTHHAPGAVRFSLPRAGVTFAF